MGRFCYTKKYAPGVRTGTEKRRPKQWQTKTRDRTNSRTEAFLPSMKHLRIKNTNNAVSHTKQIPHFYFCLLHIFYIFFTESKSSSTSFEGFGVRSETTTMQIDEKMNAGRSS